MNSADLACFRPDAAPPFRSQWRFGAERCVLFFYSIFPNLVSQRADNESTKITDAVQTLINRVGRA